MRIKDMMTQNVITTSPHSPVEVAAAQMREHDIGALPVVESAKLVGIVTDRDIAMRGLRVGSKLQPKTVRDVMTSDVVTCFSDQAIGHAAKVMAEKQIRRIVVVDREGKMVGIISLGDIAVDTADDKLSGDALAAISKKRSDRVSYDLILVPLDGSKLAEAVVPHAMALASPLHSKIVLLRVLGPLELLPFSSSLTAEAVAAPTATLTETPVAPRELREDAVAYLKAVRKNIERKGVPVEIECQEGPVGHYDNSRIAETIVERAQHLGAGLIAMSTHGRSGVGRALFGSVADSVLRSAPCPVMLLHPRQDPKRSQDGTSGPESS